MYTRDVLGHYTITGPTPETDILAAAEEILRRQLDRLGSLSSPADTKNFLRTRLAHLKHEEFHAVWLDNRHAIIAVDRLFTGSLSGASVYPREVAKTALRRNAAAVIFAHNHPSGQPEPSTADREITSTLKQTLSLLDVRILDHIVVAASGCCSLAERGLL